MASKSLKPSPSVSILLASDPIANSTSSGSPSPSLSFSILPPNIGAIGSVSVPLAALNCEGPGGSFSAYATFAAGIGWDASLVDVAERRPRGKLRFGPDPCIPPT